MTFIRKFGFGFILLFLFLAALNFSWKQNSTVVIREAKAECEIKSLIQTQGQDETKLHYTECLDPNEIDDDFWDKFWENHQSEYGQLLIQFLGMVAFAKYVAAKQEESQIESAAKGARIALSDEET